MALSLDGKNASGGSGKSTRRTPRKSLGRSLSKAKSISAFYDEKSAAKSADATSVGANSKKAKSGQSGKTSGKAKSAGGSTRRTTKGASKASTRTAGKKTDVRAKMDNDEVSLPRASQIDDPFVTVDAAERLDTQEHEMPQVQDVIEKTSPEAALKNGKAPAKSGISRTSSKSAKKVSTPVANATEQSAEQKIERIAGEIGSETKKLIVDIAPLDHDLEGRLFPLLVQKEDDLTGLIAFGLAQQNKREWLENFAEQNSRGPDDRELAAYVVGEVSPRRLATYRRLAADALEGRDTPRSSALKARTREAYDRVPEPDYHAAPEQKKIEAEPSLKKRGKLRNAFPRATPKSVSFDRAQRAASDFQSELETPAKPVRPRAKSPTRQLIGFLMRRK